MNPTDPSLKPTRVRYGVLAFCCVLSMVTYLDRVCFGTVAPFIQREFELTSAQLGYLFGAFTLAYAVFEVPTGWLGDRFGPRKTLIRIVLWWSFFTALTGIVKPSSASIVIMGTTLSVSFLSLLAVRFMFGLGEAGAYPNIARAFHNWFPFTERGSVKGAVWMAGRFAGGVTPFIVLWLIQETVVDGTTVVAWRHTFLIFGGLGIVWCVLFWMWFKDHPEQHASVNQAEIDLIHAGDATHGSAKLNVPWGKLFRSGNLWLLCGMYFCASFGWYFNITYLPGFLEDQYGLLRGEKFTSGWWSFSIMAGLPLLLGSFACLLGGVLTDLVIRKTGNQKWGRRVFGLLGHGLCALCYFLAVFLVWNNPEKANRTLSSAWMFTLAIAFAAFWNDMTMGSAWASCLDIGGRFSGIVAGCMNTIGNLGGFVANIVTGLVLEHFLVGIPKSSPEYFTASQPAWIINLAMSGVIYVIAVLLWIRFDSTKPVTPEAVGAPPEPPMAPPISLETIEEHLKEDFRGFKR